MRGQIAWGIAGLCLALVLAASAAYAHSWYPVHCCSGKDCAPIEKMEPDEKLGGYQVTTKYGTAHIPANFKWQPSQDEFYHACIIQGADEGGGTFVTVLCAFAPAGS